MEQLKAVIRLEDVHLAQAKNYVVMYNFPIGLLIKFGSQSLEFKKVFNNNDRYQKEFATKL
jgi:GxxExxY protein